MEPIVLIHGYSSESEGDDATSIEAIYGTLAADLRERFDVVSINVSRYISLDDGLDVDDLSLALDRALHEQHEELLEDGFNAIIHSTGALVMRNWVRRFSPKPSPLKRIVHLAGANLGSGWAHIGKTQIVKWGRDILFGEERGVAVLNALEFGSDWTLDLHHHFLTADNDMLTDYGVMEFNIVGSQVPAKWMLIPIRYAKEDGSDGVVRVCSSNLNFNYMRIAPTKPWQTDWKQAEKFAQTESQTDSFQDVTPLEKPFGGYYQIVEDNRPEDTAGGTVATKRPLIPFAIPYECAHSSGDVGIVYGTETRDDVLPLVQSALECTNDTEYQDRVKTFDQKTADTYAKVLKPQHGKSIKKAIVGLVLGGEFANPCGQYDKYAQIIVRVCDQNTKPVNDFSVHLNSWGGGTDEKGGMKKPRDLINTLFADTHKNNVSPNIITFYILLEQYVKGQGFVSRLPAIKGINLEIDACDALTNRILFAPVRFNIPQKQLTQWLQPHRSTIIDVELLRLPYDDAFLLKKVPINSN